MSRAVEVTSVYPPLLAPGGDFRRARRLVLVVGAGEIKPR